MYSNFNELDKLVNIVKIFNGTIYGEYVSNYYINYKTIDKSNLIDFKNINILVDSYNTFKYLLRILYINFEISKNFQYNSKYNSENKYNIFLKYNKGNIITYNLFILNIYYYYNIQNNLINSINNLDCNLLSINKNSLSIINYLHNFNKYFIFDIIYKRVIDKKFSFLQNISDINIINNNINKCISLINNDWTMDDYYLGQNSIIILLWKNISKNNFRIQFTEDDYVNLKTKNKCCICSSNFIDSDIIINTKCNHNFHWICNNDLKGLQNWVTNYSNNCPICRMKDCI